MTSALSSTMITSVTDREKRSNELRTICPESREITLRWGGEEKRLHQCELESWYRWAKDIRRASEYVSIHGWNFADRLLDLQLPFSVDRVSYMIVATYFDDDSFKLVLEVNNGTESRTFHITWQHLILLAGVGDGGRQHSLFEQCKEEHCSCDTLRKKAAGAPSAQSASPSSIISEPQMATTASRVESAATRFSALVSDDAIDHFTESMRTIADESRENTKWKLYTAREAVVRLSFCGLKPATGLRVKTSQCLGWF